MNHMMSNDQVTPTEWELYKQHKELVNRRSILVKEMSQLREIDERIKAVPASTTAHERNMTLLGRCSNAYTQTNKDKAFGELNNHKSLKEKYENMVRLEQTKKIK